MVVVGVEVVVVVEVDVEVDVEVEVEVEAMKDDKPAFPMAVQISDRPVRYRYDKTDADQTDYSGLTRRELFSAMTMQGMLSDSGHNPTPTDDVAKYALEFADALIKALDDE